MEPDQLHPHPQKHHHMTPAEHHNARLGLVLFLIYVLLYAGFVVLAAFRRELMAADFLAGVSLAVIYGFGLIIGAILLAGLYTLLCRPEATPAQRHADMEDRA